MKMVILKTAVFSDRSCILLRAMGPLSRKPHGNVKLNESGLFRRQLIKEGTFIGRRKGAWTEHRPSPDEENEFIRLRGFGGIKMASGNHPRFAENTKRRYKFPYGDFENIHRCGLLAVSRAHQYGYAKIESAAPELNGQ